MSPLLDLPAVDGVEITTIIDNSLDVTMASTSVARRLPLQRDLFTREQLHVEYGTSLLITVIDQGKRATLLFDVGLTPDGAVSYIELLGIDLSAIQVIVLSHGHIDHAGGMSGLLEKLGRRRLPILLHPDAFLKRRMVINETLTIDFLPPSLHDLQREGIELLVERGLSFLLNGTVLVTGQVERTSTFEQPFLHQVEIDGTWQPDPWVYDDQAIVIHVRNKGLVVITGCGHAGIMNILRQARSHSGVEPIYAVLGGFHLSAIRSEQIITQTVEALQQLNPAVIVPAHCTGWHATQRIVQSMPQAYTPNSVGTTFALMSLELFVDRLGLSDLTLMVQDWGGPIGHGLAGHRPELVRRLIIGNTFVWPLSGAWRMRLFSWVMGGPIGWSLTWAFNFVPKFLFARGLAQQTAPWVRAMYLEPWRDRARRGAAVIAPRQLVRATPYLQEVEANLGRLADRPTLIVWGMKDFAFGEAERARFERLFARHHTVLLDDASHFLQEDEGLQIAALYRAFRRNEDSL